MAEHVDRFDRYFAYLDAHGVADWVQLDLRIVRGLAYYTGIVFELFDAKGEFRAICGGGRYDNLLQALGGVNLPALGFGMGDVVLGELLRARGLMRPGVAPLDVWVAAAEGVDIQTVLRVVAELRRRGLSVDYTLNAAKLAQQKLSAQMRAAGTVGAASLFVVADEQHGEIKSLRGEGEPRRMELAALFSGAPLGSAA
jgi:histidyl-tRNA synthetase